MPILVGIFVSLGFLVLAVPDAYMPFRGRQLQREFARIGHLRRRAESGEGPGPLPAFRLAERLVPPLLVRLLDRFTSDRQKELFRQHTLFARLDQRLSWTQFLALKAAVPLAGGLYMGLMFLGAGFDPALAIISVIPVLGYFVPNQWLSGRARSRQAQVQRELPAVLTTLAITTEAGLGLAAAMDEVARTHQGALADEFRWASEQVALGMPQGQALESMAARCGVPDLTMFVSSLVQSFEKGASQVSATLRAQSQDAWAKRRRQAEELAQTASVRLFLPLLFLVFPAILIFLLGPALMTISEFFRSGVN